MYTNVTTFTPQEAREILDTKNFGNRPITRQVVDKYAQEMKRGRWKLSGEAVIFGKNGRLLNGQHRLKACVQSNTPFETVVVKGADDDVFDVIDDNKVRSMADILAIQGNTNSKALAAGLRFVWNYATGTQRSKGKGVIPTKQLMEKMLDRHKDIKNSAKLYAMLRARNGGMLLPASVAIGLHYLFSIVDACRADEFFTSLQSGLNLKNGSPVAVLRSKLIGDVKTVGIARNKLLGNAQIVYTIKAWNAFAIDKTINTQHLRYVPTQPLPEIDNLPQDMMKDLL